MQTHIVELKTPVSDSFRAVKAAQSVNLDVTKKSIHRMEVEIDTKTDFHVGLVVGASGSGKTTLIKKIYGEDCFKVFLDPKLAIIDQFPEEMGYEECAGILSSVGLTSIPCWIQPVYTLSNGQKARAEIALAIANSVENEVILVDEWTSVVNREVAKIMSFSLQKFARKFNRRFLLASCHYDVIDWLNPDFIVDCNKQEYIEKRGLVGSHTRSDRLRLSIREVERRTWKSFSRYHYLSQNMPSGKIYCFGLFLGKEQIGFQCYAAYVPAHREMMFSNRVVIHPDYVGLGLGIIFVTETAKIMDSRGFDVRATLTSPAMIKSREGHKNWKLMDRRIDYKTKVTRVSHSELDKKEARGKVWAQRNSAAKRLVRTHSYQFVRSAEK